MSKVLGLKTLKSHQESHQTHSFYDKIDKIDWKQWYYVFVESCKHDKIPKWSKYPKGLAKMSLQLIPTLFQPTWYFSRSAKPYS